MNAEDHVKKAEKFLEISKNPNNVAPALAIARAQVHATLALVQVRR